VKLFYLLVIISLLSYCEITAETDWKPIHSVFGVITNRIGTIKINRDDRIFIGVYGQGIYSSTDYGSSWLQYSYGENAYYQSIDDIFFDSNENMFVNWGNGMGLNYYDKKKNFRLIYRNNYFKRDYFAVNTSDELFISESFNIFKTTKAKDYEPEVFFTTPDSSDVEYMLIDPNDRIFAFTKKALYIFSKSHSDTFKLGFKQVDAALVTKNGDVFAGVKSVGVVRSLDGCKSWDTLHLINPRDTTESFVFNRFVEDSLGNVYACTTRGVYKSSDRGGKWTFFVDIPARVNVTDMAFLGNGNILVSEFYDGLFVSGDNGKNWEHALIEKFVPNVVKISAGKKGQLITGAYEDSKLNFYASSDSGKKFKSNSQQLRTDISNPFFIDSSGNVYIIQSDSKLYKNNYNSDLWNPLTIGLDYDIKTLFFISNEIILAGTFNGGVYRSVDAGISWSKSKMPDAFYTVNTFVKKGDSVFALTDSSILFSSIDNGYRWIRTACDTNLNNIRKLVRLGEYYFALTENSYLLKGKYFTGLWDKVVVNLRDSLFRDIMLLNDKFLLAAPDSSGVVITQNEALVWSDISNGLNDAKVNSLASDSDGLLYASTENNGIFSRVANFVSVNDEQSVTDDFFIIPNPANDLFHLRADKELNICSKLTIFNLLGEKMLEMQLFDYDSYININLLSQGIYLMKIETNNQIRIKKLIKK